VREGGRGTGEEGRGGEGPGGGTLRRHRRPPFLACLLVLVFAGYPAGAAPLVSLKIPPGSKQTSELTALASKLELAVREMAARVPVELKAPITVTVEPDYVSQGLHAGEIGEAVRGRDADLLLVYNPADLPAYRYALAGVLLDRAGLAAKLPPGLARGAALWLSRDWYGKPYPDWLPRLAAARVLPDAAELLAGQEPAGTSILLEAPAAAMVVDRLSGATLAARLARLPEGEKIRDILQRLGTAPGASAAAGRPAPARSEFLKGVSLAMMNRLEGGYHAPAAERQLEALQRLGANAVSLMPFAFQRAPDRPELRFLSHGPASETDIGLIHAARSARARGIRVLWKPHLWVGGGSWTGEIAMKSEADWAAWWKGYRRYILHHALLAQWAGADLFCAGVELSKTIGREAEWRELIAAVRAFFPGPVTYAANWYGDLESVRFWDQLDFVGVDAYFPLAAAPGADRAALQKGAQLVAGRLARAARRSDRPVLLTEVGFAARREAWMSPHLEGGEYSEEDQAAAYEALFGALGRQPWLAGTFVWKAFSSGGGEGDRRRGSASDFRFQGRKAEAVISRYYSSK
jgi:hypothetical protein